MARNRNKEVQYEEGQEGKEEDRGPCFGPTAIISDLGTAMQTAVTIAGISVAVFAVLRTLPPEKADELNIPCGVAEVFSLVSFCALAATGFAVWGCWRASRAWESQRLEFSFILVWISTLSLAVALVLFVARVP